MKKQLQKVFTICKEQVMRYKIGDLVLVKVNQIETEVNPRLPVSLRIVYEIDGVTEKMVDGGKVIRYESGSQIFLETEVEGKVILEKPRAPRTRKSKVKTIVQS